MMWLSSEDDFKGMALSAWLQQPQTFFRHNTKTPPKDQNFSKINFAYFHVKPHNSNAHLNCWFPARLAAKVWFVSEGHTPTTENVPMAAILLLKSGSCPKVTSRNMKICT